MEVTTTMRKIAVLTDSACDIPVDLQEKYGIDILPFVITLDGVSYVERQDFTFDEYYQMLREAKSTPSTAHITAMQFCDQYCKYIDEGYTDVLYVSINSTGSATYDAAHMAKDLLEEERPGHNLKIHLVDSHTYSFVYGWSVCEAARLLQNGAELEYVLDMLHDRFSRAEVLLSAYSLKVMKKSGRISAAAAFAGELLGLRPIISMIDGKTKVEAKVRGDAAVPGALIKQVRQKVENIDDDFEYMIAYTDIDAVHDLIKQCKKEFGHEPLYVFKLGAAVSSNTGPDAVAVVYWGKSRA